jgi:hypothetical protein
MSPKKAPEEKKKKEEPKPKPVRRVKERKPQSEVQVPLLLDVAFNFSIIFILLVGGLVAVISLLAGVDPLNTALRTGLAILLLGLGLYGLAWYLSKSSLDTALAEKQKQVEEASEQDDVSTTTEVKA